MEDIEIVELPKVKPRLDFDVYKKAWAQVEEEGQVIVHCSYTPTVAGDKIRIWKSTFLYSKNSSHASPLVHTENISLYPVWTDLYKGKTIRFTLIFKPLPKSCTHFDLLENIPQAGGFYISNIARNEQDVYFVDLG